MRPTPAPKRTLADKLILWREAYYAVLDEITPPAVKYSGGLQLTQTTHELRAAAARTAAILIQGVADGSDASS